MTSGTTHDRAATDGSPEVEEPRSATVRTTGHMPPGGPLGLIAVLALLVGLVVTAFALPAVHSEPRDVPIGIAGPPPAVQQVSAALAANAPGAFAVTALADEAALTAAIRNRDVYGGIAIGQAGPTMLTAPAASPAVAQGLSTLAANFGQQQGRPVAVKEVVSLPAKDSRGAGLATALLPLLIAAVAPVLAMKRVLRGRWTQLAGVLSAAIVLGAVVAGLLHWYGVLDGNWFLDAGAMAMVIGAMSTALLGLLLAGGLPAFGLGIATFLLLGNPLSGMATAPEFLAEPWQTIGAWLPVGAGGQLLRSTAYFDGAGSGPHLIVLGVWFLLGLALLAIARKAPQPRPVTPQVATT